MGRKHKKQKKRKHYTSSSSSDSSDEHEWVEKVAEEPTSSHSENIIKNNEEEKALERDEWMNVESFIPCVSRSEMKRQKSDIKEQNTRESLMDKPGQSDKELNPYWKDGGDGLPQNNIERPKLLDANWLKKGLQRAKEQAIRDGRSLEEIAAERWGSLETIQSMIAKAESQASNAGSRRYHQKYHDKKSSRDRHRDFDSGIREHSRFRSDSKERSRTRGKYSTFDRSSEDMGYKRNYQKPKDHDDYQERIHRSYSSHSKKNWKKDKGHDNDKKTEQSPPKLKQTDTGNTNNAVETDESESIVLTEDEMNKLGAKLVKAEIMGDQELIGQLKRQLEQARKLGPINNKDNIHKIKEHKTYSSKHTDNCPWCPDSENMLKHMIITMDSMICLSLPACTSLTTGHCILTPINHVASQLQLDEDVWEKLKEVKQKLIEMFMKQDLYLIFFEMYKKHRKCSHMHMECIPLPKELGELGPMYFKKALLECETEWSTNKKVVDLKNKNIRHAVPNCLPYFMVEFASHPGYAHVLEDERTFPQNFAEEIIGGMLDLDCSLWRKPKKQSFDEQKRKVLEFTEMWKKSNT